MHARLQGLVRETAEASVTEMETSLSLRRQLEAVRSEHSAQQKALQQVLEERNREVADLTAEQDVLLQQVRGLQESRRHEPPTKQVATDHKFTQTINLEVDLKVSTPSKFMTGKNMNFMFNNIFYLYENFVWFLF